MTGNAKQFIIFSMKKLNVALVALNSKYIHSSLGVWYISAGIKSYSKYPHNTCVIEGTINQDLSEVINAIIEKEPNIIGLSCYIWNITKALIVARAVKDALPHSKIVLGGPEVSFNAGDVLFKNAFVDYVVSGEGEKPFAMLCDCIADGFEPDIDGVCTRDKITAPYILDDIPPTPYSEEYYNTLNNRIVYFEASRGCPFNCAFCLSSRCTGVKHFELERVEKELLSLANSGAKTIKFVDRTFNAHKVRAKNIVKFICDNYGKAIPNGVCFHFEIAGDILDDELISLFTSAPNGAIQFEIGMQSFNEITLEYINRKTDTKVLIQNINKLVSARNMHIHVDLIAGLPYEDFKSFKESFNIAYNLNADMLQLGFLKLLHGAPMREDTDKFPCEYSPEPPYEVISTPWLSKADIETLKAVEDAVDRAYNSGRFKDTIDYAINCGHSPFEVFLHISHHIKCSEGVSLKEYTEQLYSAILTLEGVDADILRDNMVCDLFKSTKGAKLPDVLKRADPRLKKAVAMLGHTKGTMFAAAVLYSKNQLVYVNYDRPDPVTNSFKLNFLPLDKFE